MQSYRLNNTTCYIVQKDQEEQISLEMFGLSDHIPTLTLVGDTKYNQDEMAHHQPFFERLAEALTQPDHPTAIIDGATNFGVMKLFGEAFGKRCQQIGKVPAPLIGATLRVAVQEENMLIEPHHAYALLTSGNKGEWTKAVPWMRRVQTTITGKNPSALLAVGGGRITLQHMHEHAIAGIPLYVLLGSGDLPLGFLEANKHEDERDPNYRYLLDEHKSLLKNATVILVNQQEAIDQIKDVLYSRKQTFPNKNYHLLATR